MAGRFEVVSLFSQFGVLGNLEYRRDGARYGWYELRSLVHGLIVRRGRQLGLCLTSFEITHLTVSKAKDDRRNC